MKRRLQTGAVTLWLASALLSLVLFSSLALDMARLAYQRHALQSVADLAALKISHSTPYFIGTDNSNQLETQLIEEYQDKIDTLNIRFGTAKIVDNAWVIDTSSTPLNGYQSAQIIITKVVPKSMVAGGLFNNQKITLTASAAIQKTGWIRFGIGSKTVSLSESGMLNGLLSGMLGIDIDLDVLDYNGLLNSSVDLSALIAGVAIAESLGSTQQVLDTSVSLLTLLEVYLNILESGDSYPNALNLIINQLNSIDVPIPDVKLGDLLSLSTTSNTNDAALATSINAFELVTSTIYAANQSHFVEIPNLDVNIPGVTSANLKANIVQPPIFSLGTLPVVSGEEPSVENAEIELSLSADLQLLNLINAITSIAGLSLEVSPLSLSANISKSKATLNQLTAVDGDVMADFSTHSSLVDVTIEPIMINAKLELLGFIGLVDLGLKANVDVVNKDSVPNLIAVSLASLPTEQSVMADQQFSASVDIEILTNSAPIIGNTTTALLSSTLNTVLEAVVSNILSSLLLPTLQSLGVQVGGANIWVDGVDANQHGLIL